MSKKILTLNNNILTLTVPELTVSSVTGATNLGGVGIFSQVNDYSLEFKGLVAGNNITLVPSLTGITINSNIGGDYVTEVIFSGYTASTETRISGIEDDVTYLSGQTASKVSTTKFNTYTGTTAPAQFAAKTNFNTFTGTTAPATYQSKASINIYTGTTAPNQFASKSAFLTYTGTTAPAQFAAKSNFNTYTGTTAPNQFANRTTFNTYTGTTNTAINNRLLISSFNTYSGTTLTNINSRLLTSAFNTYSGLTLTNINSRLLTSAFNTYSGATLTNINSRLLTSVFNAFTGSSSNITTANNGLNRIGNNVRLGGSLTGATTITSPATGSRLSFAGFPVQYSTDVSANYNTRSHVDLGYVTGQTSTRLLTSAFNTYSGLTLTNINSRLLTSAFNTYSGATLTNINTRVNTANNGLNKVGSNVRLGGTLTGATTITTATGSRLNIAGWPMQYATDLSANFSPRSLVDKAYVTGLTSANVYGTQYQLASDLASTSTNSTTPIDKVTMNTSSLPAGTYKILVNWLWSRNTVSNSARFDVTIGGVTQGTAGTIELEANDATDIRPETRVFYVALSGVNTIAFRHWGESGGNSTTTSDATIELIRVA